MQSENPRTPGPRICALRIQNGSNNILLDNVNEDSFSGENNMVTPIVYTRRSKFLDEELDDDKDITTGCDLAIEKPLEISMVMNNHNSNCISNNINNINIIDTLENDSKLPSDIKNLNNSHDAISDDSKKLINICKSPGGNIISNNIVNNNSDNSNIIYNSISINHNVKNKLYLNANNKRFGDKLDSDTLNSKSLTQSSSISSELDIQESALLRRQQLSRVAEWVQNNSTIIVNNNNNINSDDTVNRTASALLSQSPSLLTTTTTSSTTMTITSPMLNKTPIASNNLINLNNNVNSIVDSDNVNENFVNLLNACKIHSNNNINNNNDMALPNDSNDNIAMAGNNMYKISDVRKELENQTNFQIAQNINNNEQYLDSCKQMKNFNNNMNDPNEQQQVDIAQMEYNVKQFLLKQNEWSMCNKRSSLTTTASTTPVRKQFHRTETNL